MKNQSSSTRVMLPFLLILGLICVSPGIASADYIHDAIKFYADVQDTVGKIPNCPDAKDLLNAEEYIRLIVKGDVEAAELAVPPGIDVSSFDLFFKALKYYAEDNYWDFAWTFGEGFACAFLQMWSGGVWDVCGTFMEIYKFCKDVYEDVIGPALEWIEDAGEAIGCFVFGWGCKDTPPPPPEELAFIENYYRRGCEGVKAKESTSPYAKFKYLEDTLFKEAMATYQCGMVTSMGPYLGSSIVCNKNIKTCWACRSRTDCDFTTYKYASTFSDSKCRLRYVGPGPVNVAAKKYTDLVNAKWSQHVNAKVKDEIMKERFSFMNSGIHDAAMAAMKSEKPADIAVVEFCRSHFRAGQKISSFQCDLVAQFPDLLDYDYSLDSFDRWLELTKAGVSSNAQYCQDEFWSKNREKFKSEFKIVISNYGCPLAGDKFKCQSAASYKACGNLLGSVGLAGMCSVNVSAVGLDAAKYVSKYLKDHGSTHPCMSSQASAAIIGASGIEKAVILACGRPTQVPNCKAAYKEFADKHNLPVQVLQCVQGPLSAQYKADIETVKTKVAAKIGALNPQYPVESRSNDPLLIMLDDQKWGEVKDKVGSRVYSGLVFAKHVPDSMDGVDKPTIWSGDRFSSSLVPQALKPALSGIDKTKPPVPDVNKPLSSAEKMPRSSALAGAAKNLDSAGIAGGQPAQQRIAEGKLPSSAASGGAAKARGAGMPGAASTAGATLPDLSATERVVVGGVAGSWSGTISVDAGKATSRANGICRFPIEFSVRNQGAVSTGAFRITLTNSSAPDRLMRSISSVKGGGVQEVKDLVPLKPGKNLLQMTVDEAGQVTEQNESNNVYRLTVIVGGSCSPMPAASGGAGVSPAVRKALEGAMPGR